MPPPTSHASGPPMNTRTWFLYCFVTITTIYLLYTGFTTMSVVTHKLMLKLRPIKNDFWQIEAVPEYYEQKLNYALCIIAIGGVSHWKKVSIMNKLHYAKSHGYHLFILDESPVPARHPSWQKVVALTEIFQSKSPRYDWVWVVDMDLFIMNIDVPLSKVLTKAAEFKRDTSSSMEVIMAQDCRGINGGSVLWHNSEWTQKFLKQVWRANDPKVVGPKVNAWWEQAAIIYVRQHNPEVDNHLVVVSQKVMNSYPPMKCKGPGQSGYIQGDFVLHFPGPMKAQLLDYIHDVPVGIDDLLERNSLMSKVGDFSDSVNMLTNTADE